jgi:Co/Zn/Cd efflux system component
MHDHTHTQDYHNRPDSQRLLTLVVGLTLGYLIVEAAAGWLSGSLALLNDADHMLTDSTALGLAALAAWTARRPPSPRHSYGLGRLEALAELFNALLMVALLTAIRAAMHLSLEEVGRAMARVEGVLSVHDLHIWSLCAESAALSAHVVLRRIDGWEPDLQRLRELLAERFGIEHVTLQPEPVETMVRIRRGRRGQTEDRQSRAKDLLGCARGHRISAKISDPRRAVGGVVPPSPEPKGCNRLLRCTLSEHP